MTADDLVEVREPVRWTLELGQRVPPSELRGPLCRALRGPAEEFTPPGFLLPHQIDACQRIVAALRLFGGALLCDAVGLGKTYVALATAQRYRRVTVVAPATVVSLWRHVARTVGSRIVTISHDALSRGRQLGEADLVIVDEAHRVCHPQTKRYQTLARCVRSAHVLIVTATPIVNTPLDLLHLVRLFLPDHGLSIVGLPSLEAALTNPRSVDILRSLSTILVSRSPTATRGSGLALPRTIDSPLVAAAPLADPHLSAVLERIDGLHFPTFESRQAAELLRLHMVHRLSSSTKALLQTVQRHRTYLTRAFQSAQRGERLTRGSARRLFGPDERPQLDLDLFSVVAAPRDTDLVRFTEELQRLDALRTMIREHTNPNAKLIELLRMLRARRGSKTVVFATAVATAIEIAEHLQWKAVAVVTGGGARIASGPIPVHDAVLMFAPLANGRRASHANARLDVLVATDVLSEGINLQDADTVIHYDLPWTPLRLQQRVGRIARLGSSFDRVQVRWLIPSPVLEQRLAIGRRIAAKVAHQQRFGVPISSRVGVATVIDRTLERRETLIAQARRHAAPFPRHAVVRAGHVAAFALEWLLPHGTVPDVFVLRGTPPTCVDDLDAVCRALEDIVAAPPSDIDPGWMPIDTLASLVRDRWAATLRGPSNTETKRLLRLVVTRAKERTAARQFGEIDALDSVLDRISAGLSVGGERTLYDLLTNDLPVDDRGARWSAWSRQWRRPQIDVCAVRVSGAIIGDGTC